MAKIPRIHIEGGIFYITSRGDNNEEIFKDNTDYAKYLELLKKYKTQYGFKCFSFCLLPNHLHLLLELKEGLTISDVLHDLNSNYTKYFNSKYAKKGHLFQERYKMVIAQKNNYLLNLANYIHLNPLTLGLVKDLKDYPYSSYLYYTRPADANMGSSEIPMQDEVKEIMLRLIEADIKDYAAYLNSMPKEDLETIGKDLARKLILGEEGFVERVKKSMEKIETAAELSRAGTDRYKVLYISGIAVLTVFCVFFFAHSLNLKKLFFTELQKKETEISSRLAKERKAIVKDLQEKHSADMVSYDAMAKRVELEKKRAQELESKLSSVKAGK